MAAPSLWEYLTTHGMADYIDKFVVGGVFKVAGKFALYLGPLWAPLLLTLTIVRCAFSRDDRWRLRIPLLLVLFPLAGFVPVFDIFDSVRYFAPIAPFALLLSIATLMRLIGKEKFSGLMAVAFLLVLIAQPVLEVSQGSLQLMKLTVARPQVQDEWAHWAAQNLSGSIAIVEGGDLITLSELAAKGGNAEHLSSLGVGRETFRPSDYSSLAIAYQDFRERRVDYVLIDDANSVRRPFLREVYEPVWTDRFILIKSFRNDPTDRGVIKDMDVFRVVY